MNLYPLSHDFEIRIVKSNTSPPIAPPAQEETMYFNSTGQKSHHLDIRHHTARRIMNFPLIA